MSSPKSHNQPNNHILFVRSELQCITHTYTHMCISHCIDQRSINLWNAPFCRFGTLLAYVQQHHDATLMKSNQQTGRLADRQTDNYSELPEYFYIFTPSHFSFFVHPSPFATAQKNVLSELLLQYAFLLYANPIHPIPIIVPISTARMQCNAMPMVATILILPHTYIYKHRRRRCLLFATSMTYLNNRFNCTKAKDMIRVVMEEKR